MTSSDPMWFLMMMHIAQFLKVHKCLCVCEYFSMMVLFSHWLHTFQSNKIVFTYSIVLFKVFFLVKIEKFYLSTSLTVPTDG